MANRKNQINLFDASWSESEREHRGKPKEFETGEKQNADVWDHLQEEWAPRIEFPKQPGTHFTTSPYDVWCQHRRLAKVQVLQFESSATIQWDASPLGVTPGRELMGYAGSIRPLCQLGGRLVLERIITSVVPAANPGPDLVCGFFVGYVRNVPKLTAPPLAGKIASFLDYRYGGRH